MCKGLNKVVFLTGLGLLCSCSNNNNEAAKSLLEEARMQYESGLWTQSLELLDSIDRAFPEQIELRREAMHLRPQIIEKQSLIELQYNDSIIAELTLESQNLKKSFSRVSDGFEGYYTTKSLAGKSPADKEGIYARMSPDGVISLISSARPGTMSTAIKLSSGADEAISASVSVDGERNDRSMGREIITFMPDECDTIGKFAINHRSEPIKVTFIGKNSYSINLDKDQLDAIVRLYSAESVVSKLRTVQLEKSRLERQIDIARSQAARTFREAE
ncbi:MAG: hypothetical protein J1E38_04875 [Paramuribaculum sp.]|nr:hypothetical protein [Paramuribaculum sp.]